MTHAAKRRPKLLAPRPAHAHIMQHLVFFSGRCLYHKLTFYIMFTLHLMKTAVVYLMVKSVLPHTYIIIMTVTPPTPWKQVLGRPHVGWRVDVISVLFHVYGFNESHWARITSILMCSHPKRSLKLTVCLISTVVSWVLRLFLVYCFHLHRVITLVNHE